jgi:hypothetical protein
VPALQGAKDDVLDLICWRDDPHGHLLELQIGCCGESFAPVENEPVFGDFERLDDPAPLDVVVERDARG